MITLFGKKTLETLIVPVVGRTFNSGDVGGYGHVFLQELGIDDVFEGRKPRARVVVNEAVRQLSCDYSVGRDAARDSLTSLLMSPTLVERDTGKLITALMRSWRDDLRQALEGTFSREQIAESDSQLIIRVEQAALQASCRQVEKILFKEHEHTDWILRLLASRSAAFRVDLELAEAQLNAFHAQRAAISIKLTGDSFAKEATIFKLERISIEDDQAFLEELHHRTSVYQEQLRRENFPYLLSDVVERQLLVPAATADAMACLQELDIPPESLSLSERDLREGSPEEFIEARKLDAARFMGSVAVEAGVFHHRINHRPHRCIPLENLPPIDVPREVEVAQIGESLRAELVKIVRDSDIEERIVSNLIAEFNSHCLTAPEPLPAVLCFSCYIPAADTMGQRARMILVTAEVQSEALPWDGDDIQDEDAPDDDIFEPSRNGADDLAIEDGTSQTEAWLHGNGEELVDELDPQDDWMESDILVLEEREGRDLLTDGSLLVRWLAGFQGLLREPRSVDTTAVTSDDDVDDDSDTLASEKYAGSEGRYHGLKHDEVEAAFRSTFSTSKDSDSEYHRSFFGLVAERYAAVWDLLPTDNKLQPTILPIEWTSPIEAAIEALFLLERHSKEIESLSHEQKENVRAWLRSFKEAYGDGESTVGQLWSLAVWRLVADVYRGEESGSWRESDPEEDGDDVEDAEGWCSALQDTRGEMFAPYFHESQHHVLETCLTTEASEAVKQLVARGHLYLDALSAEFITCLNELSITEIQEAIIQRADHELALNSDEPSSGWFDCRNDSKASAALALRSSSKGVWANIRKFRA